MTKFRTFLTVFLLFGLCAFVSAQQDDHSGHSHDHPANTEHKPDQHPAAPQVDEAGHPVDAHEHPAVHTNEAPHGAEAHDSPGCGHASSPDDPFDVSEVALHHTGDANAFHIWGDLYIPLPCILYAPEKGWTVTSSSVFKTHHHGNGTVAKDGYALVHGSVMRVKDPAFPQGEVELDGEPTHEVKNVNGKDKTVYYVQHGGQCYELDYKTTFDGGVLGGGVTSFYDFSISRNVLTMLLAALLLLLTFRSVASAYVKRKGQAPKGLQGFFEPLITFIRDEVAKPNIGKNYEKYMPYLLSAFFFILGLNLVGQIPVFPGGANVTGSISVTLVLALITFFITIFSANKHFWEHTLWMPGVPAILKILILTPVEIMGLFLKPFTLLLRLCANISAGHIVIISFVGLIFILGKSGQSLGGSIAGTALAVPLTLFMMALELLVAFLQAFIFTMLSASYIGAAIEEGHHDDHH